LYFESPPPRRFPTWAAAEARVEELEQQLEEKLREWNGKMAGLRAELGRVGGRATAAEGQEAGLSIYW
jgi:hypothetical protein